MGNSSDDLPPQMAGVVLTGHGGLDQLVYRTDLPLPVIGDEEVLIRVAASAINNTDINTRVGWYSKQVKSATSDGAERGFEAISNDDAAWSGAALQFPRIQGADCCGKIVAVGASVDVARIGERVLVRPMQSVDDDGYQCITFGSEMDGGFAQYAKVNGKEAFAINSTLSDAALASFPCAYSTAENMLTRASLRADDVVLITGASGGVGSAAVQLAKCRGAYVIAICSRSKSDEVSALGADKVIDREADLCAVIGQSSVDVVIDLVAGDQWSVLLDLLRRGGRYAVAGAIAGPMVTLDVRTLYLKDLSFYGCTYQPSYVFAQLIRLIESGKLKPVIAAEYPLSDIQQAQRAFMAKGFVGKLVLIHP